MGVYSIAEISTAAGDEITTEAWGGTRKRFTTTLWPAQNKPGKACIHFWRKILTKVFLVPHNNYITKKSQNRKLRQQLGEWIIHSQWFRRKWNTYYSPTTKAIITKNKENLSHTRNNHIRNSRNSTRETRKRRMLFNKHPTPIDIVPDDIIPIDCLHDNSFIQTPGFSKIQKGKEITAITTWHTYISDLQPWDKELLADIHIKNEPALKRLLQTKENIYICSDGGAKDDIGSFGAVIANNKEILIHVTGQAYGKAPRSFRAEGYGILAILRFLLHFTQFNNISTQGKLKIYSDNEGFIIRVKQIKDFTHILPRRGMLSESDVELQIRDTLQLLQTDIELQHVLGHQDTNKEIRELSWPAQLNIQCDILATNKLRTLNPQNTVPTLPASKIMLQIVTN